MADEIIHGLIERQIKASGVYQKGVMDERARCLEIIHRGKNVEELIASGEVADGTSKIRINARA